VQGFGHPQAQTLSDLPIYDVTYVAAHRSESGSAGGPLTPG